MAPDSLQDMLRPWFPLLHNLAILPHYRKYLVTDINQYQKLARQFAACLYYTLDKECNVGLLTSQLASSGTAQGGAGQVKQPASSLVRHGVRLPRHIQH